MTDARAISAQLVDIRNVGAHKCVKLTIHVPEEQALHVTQLFGWPTGAAPVSVALARLEVPAPSVTCASSSGEREPESDPGLPAERGHKSPAQIAGYLCTQVAFQKFLKEKFGNVWKICMEDVADTSEDWGRDAAAKTVRYLCDVTSRAHITEHSTEWLSLMLAWKLWNKEAEVVPA